MADAAEPAEPAAEVPDADELERLGAYDPTEPDAAEKLWLIRYVMEKGATVEQVRAATNLGELALDLHLRPRGDQTLREVLDAASLEWEPSRRMLTAIGLPTVLDALVTVEEAQTIQMLGAVSTNMLGESAALQVARVAGAAMARVAEAIVAAFRIEFELPRRDTGTPDSDVVREYAAVAETMLPPFVRALDVMLRRQIVAVAERMWSPDESRRAVTLPRTVGFVDLVGYTAAAATMSARQLTEALVAFDEQVGEAVIEGGGQLVKTIGDEALFVTEDPAAGCRIGLALVERFDRGPLPQVRVGLAVGQVVSVFGDVYGPDVNLAARLVSAAEPSTVYVSAALRDRCGDDLAFEAIGPLTLKGFAEPVEAYRLAPDGLG